MGFHTTINLTGLSAPGSIFERFLGNRCQVVWKSYSWLNIMGGYLHSYTEFRTFMVRTYMDLSTKRWTSTLSKFDEPFGVRFHFWKIFGNRCRLVWRSYSWFDMTRLYTHWLQAYQQKDRLSHLIQNLTSLSAFGSILKIFGGNRVGRCEDHTFGWIWQDYVHAYQRKDRLSYY